MTSPTLNAPRSDDRLQWYIRAHLKVRHLEVLVALDELRSLARVAGYLHVSQPAVSKTLIAIEEGMAAALFKRTARGLVPTEVGECLIRHARAVLDRLREAQDDVRDIREGHVVRASIGVLPWAAVVVMPRFIAGLEARAPEATVSVREGTQDALLAELRAGNIDFVVGVLPDKPLGTEFASDVLVDDTIVVAVRCGHPLERRRRLTWEDLGSYPMVLPPLATYIRGTINSFFEKHRISLPPRKVESLSTMTNVGALQLTDSVGLLSRVVARHFVELGMLSVLPLGVAGVRMRLGLIWRAERTGDKAHDVVLQVFQETRDMLLAGKSDQEGRSTLGAGRRRRTA